MEFQDNVQASFVNDGIINPFRLGKYIRSFGETASVMPMLHLSGKEQIKSQLVCPVLVGYDFRVCVSAGEVPRGL